MNLARHHISPTKPVQILDANFDADCDVFAASTPEGFAVYRTYPLQLIRKREMSGGTLAKVLPLHSTNLVFLQGGGRSPLYPPNKVIVWNDVLAKEVAELEFRERVRGMACRRGWLAVALRRRVVVFRIQESISRVAEWDTCDNPRGLLAMATAEHSTLLAIAGKQIGHVQLIHLPPCPAPVLRGPPPSTLPRKPQPPPTSPDLPPRHAVSIIAAHTSALTTLAMPPSGRLLATTSVQGTLVRIWDSKTGKLIRELRRGSDKADIYGVAFRPDEEELCVWSDKGTIHIFTLLVSGSTNRQSSLSGLTNFLPLPKYFESEWSYAQYRIPVQSAHISLSSTTSSRPPNLDLPEEERCVVGWIKGPEEDSFESGTENAYQLIALTFTGGWYRLALPVITSTKRGHAAGGHHHGAGGAAASMSGSPPRHSPFVNPPKSISGSSTVSRLDKGKGRDGDRDKDKKESRNCTLKEYRRFGRWDGWG